MYSEIVIDYFIHDAIEVSFILKNTLSKNSAAIRGIYESNTESDLKGIYEISNIVKTTDGFIVDNDGILTPIDTESYVSMNMWRLD